MGCWTKAFQPTKIQARYCWKSSRVSSTRTNEETANSRGGASSIRDRARVGWRRGERRGREGSRGRTASFSALWARQPLSQLGSSAWVSAELLSWRTSPLLSLLYYHCPPCVNRGPRTKRSNKCLSARGGEAQHSCKKLPARAAPSVTQSRCVSDCLAADWS